jgi:hypothetical protein
MEADTCRRCKRSTNDTASYRLWDGHTYCRTCVQEAGSELAVYARDHSTLRDNPAFSVWRLRLHFFWVQWLVSTVLFGTVATVATLEKHGAGGVLSVVLWLQLLILPAVLLFTLGIIRQTDWSIEIKNGVVWIARARRGFPFSNCEWLIGKATQATRPLFPPRLDAVLLATRVEGMPDEEVVVATVNPGMTPVWTQFLTLSGRRCRRIIRRNQVVRRTLRRASPRIDRSAGGCGCSGVCLIYPRCGNSVLWCFFSLAVVGASARAQPAHSGRSAASPPQAAHRSDTCNSLIFAAVFFPQFTFGIHYVLPLIDGLCRTGWSRGGALFGYARICHDGGIDRRTRGERT